MFDADVIAPSSGNNCNITCPVNTEIQYVCEDRMTGRATCTETSTWNQPCEPLGKYNLQYFWVHYIFAYLA